MFREPFIGSTLLNATQLGDHLRKLASDRTGLYAVYLRVQRGVEVIGQPWPAAVLRDPLWTLTGNRSASLYALSETDLVLLCKNAPVDQVDEAVARVIRLFDVDGSGLDGIGTNMLSVTWFDLVRNADYQSLLRAVDSPENCIGHDLVVETMRPIGIPDLPAILERMQRAPIGRLIRSHNVLQIRPRGQMVPLFRETSVSIGEFQRAFAPGIDITTHPALLGHLAECLDQAILTHLVEEDRQDITTGSFSVNIDLATISLPIFSRFEEAFAHRNDIFLEFQFEDVLEDAESYFAVQRRLRRTGFGIIIDGVKTNLFQHLDLAGFEADFIKVICPDVARFDPPSAPTWMRGLENIDREQIILAGVEAEERMKWALGHGVSRLQGRFIDLLITALTSKGILATGAKA